MTKLIVTKPFNTPLRRFAVGAEVDPQEIDGPVGAEQWRDRGFLRDPSTEKPATPAKRGRA